MFERKTKSVAAIGECCPVLDMALRRDTSKDTRQGFEVATPFGLSDGKPRAPAIIYRFRKGKKDNPRETVGGTNYWDTTYAMARFCPFCGAQLEREPEKAKPR